jgi:hypothetical protein
MKTTMRYGVLIGLSLAVIYCACGVAEAAGRLSVSVTINEGPSACTFTLLVSAANPGPIGGKAPGAVYTTGACGPAVDLPAGIYDVKVVNTTLWDKPEKWSRAINVADGVTKNVTLAFEAGNMNLNFSCTPCRAEVHPPGGGATLSSQCGTGSRQVSIGTYDVRFQLGPDLEVWKRGIVISKGDTRGVKPF